MTPAERKAAAPEGFRWTGDGVTNGTLRVELDDSGQSLRVDYDASDAGVGCATAVIVWAPVHAVAALLRAAGWTVEEPVEECTENGVPIAPGSKGPRPDPRDARIAALEAALREARGMLDCWCDEGTDDCEYCRVNERIDALLAKPGAG